MTHLYALTSNDLSLCPDHKLDPSMSSPTQNDLLYLYTEHIRVPGPHCTDILGE